ncbi:MAG: alpha/beta fold hydrolase [Xanthomonadales bacterium]|nr:alpha/beta fold hydrolase [Xanthomonadales bacterium]
MRIMLTVMFLLLIATTGSTAQVQRWTANDGQLILEDIPSIPESLPPILSRYQNIRSASFASWSKDSKSIFIKTRLGPVTQLHRVDKPGGARYQVTFGEEPIGEVRLQPNSNLLALTQDEGGDEFDQVFLFNPEDGLMRMLSDGEALNNRMAWDRQGQKLAYRSTRRNGRSNDIWIQNPASSEPASLLLATDDGTLWKPVDFSRDGKKLLIQQFVSVADSRIYIKDLPDGELRLLAGDAENPSSNIATGFDRQDNNVFFVTNQHGGAAELAQASLDEVPAITFVPSTSNWDITQFVLSPDRKRGAFVANEGGISRLYMFDPERLIYKRVGKIPMGLVSDLKFSPNSKKLGMTLNSARNPNEAFVLGLKRKPLAAGNLTRWTFSETGGLDTDKFSEPIAVSFLSSVEKLDKEIAVPAFAYLPPGKGPFPVIIHVHGGPENQFRPRFNSDFQLWIDQLGVAVIAPNIRGSLGYGSYFITMDDGYNREASVEDIGALLDWIAQQPQLDKDRVAIIGASYGGYVALASAAHYSDRLRAAVDRVGISNFVTFLENTQDYRRVLRRVEYGDERDPEMRAFLEKISPLNNVDKIKIPLFVQQGSNDPIVPKSESDQMVKALRERGQTVWYMNALNEGHGYGRRENRDLFEQATFLFLQRYLLGD